MSWLYERLAKECEPYGIMPADYIRELRSEDVSWPDIGRCLQIEMGHAAGAFTIFHTPTLKRWVGEV